jgi:hypothetical protein
MSDVLARLMRWMETSDIDDAGVVLRDAITEIAGLRARLHEHRIAAQRLAELSGARQQGETGQPVLTDAEREAIEGMAAYFDTRGNITLQAWGSLLRVLLMRWK